MELTFLYIKDYGRVKDMGLNFSSKFRFNYNSSNGKLKVEKIRDYSERFYKNYDAKINSVSAIVGQNGVGKSTILNFIKRNFVDGSGGVQYPCIVGIYDQESDTHKVYVFEIDQPILSKNSIAVDLLRLENKLTEVPGFEIHKSINAFEQITFINYSSLLDLSPDEGEYGSSFNITTNYYAYTASDKQTGEDKRFNYNEIDLYRIQEVERQLRFYSSNKNLLPFKMPDHLVLRLNNFNQLKFNKDLNDRWKITKDEIEQIEGKSDKTEKEIEDLEKLKDYLNRLETFGKDLSQMVFNLRKYGGESFRNNILVQIFFSIIKGNFLFDHFTKWIKTNFEEALRKVEEEENKDGLTLLKLFINECEIQPLNEENKSRYIDYIELLPKLDALLNKCFHKGNDYLDTEFLKLNEENEALLLDFFQVHTNVTYSNFIDYYWPLSSGQQTLFSLYSRFYDVIHRTVQFANIEVKQNILILLDEAEISLHPEWQRSFLDDFLKVISTLFKDKNIQIVLATHSPFLLSDLVTSQINFIEYDQAQNRGRVVSSPLSEKKSTFGSNITTLLQDSFFMKDGFAGAIVLREMDDFIDFILHKDLKTIKDDYEYVDWFIHQIGEPIVRNKLIQLLESRLSTDLLNTQERLNVIEKRLNNLENPEDDKN